MSLRGEIERLKQDIAELQGSGAGPMQIILVSVAARNHRHLGSQSSTARAHIDCNWPRAANPD